VYEKLPLGIVGEIKPQAEEAIRQNGGKIKKVKNGCEVEIPLARTNGKKMYLPCGCALIRRKWRDAETRFTLFVSVDLVEKGKNCIAKKHRR
jgi:hypothetical protein